MDFQLKEEMFRKLKVPCVNQTKTAQSKFYLTNIVEVIRNQVSLASETDGTSLPIRITVFHVLFKRNRYILYTKK